MRWIKKTYCWRGERISKQTASLMEEDMWEPREATRIQSCMGPAVLTVPPCAAWNMHCMCMLPCRRKIYLTTTEGKYKLIYLLLLLQSSFLKWHCDQSFRNVPQTESALSHTLCILPEKVVFRMSGTSQLAGMSGGLATRAERQIALYYQSAYEYEMIIQWWPSSFSIQLCYGRDRLDWFITGHVWVRGQMSRKCNRSQSFRLEY